jgi:hypothetical protein
VKIYLVFLFSFNDIRAISKLNRQCQCPAVVGACKDCGILGMIMSTIQNAQKGQSGTVYPGNIRFLSGSRANNKYRAAYRANAGQTLVHYVAEVKPKV